MTASLQPENTGGPLATPPIVNRGRWGSRFVICAVVVGLCCAVGGILLRPAYVSSAAEAEYQAAVEEQNWPVALQAAERWSAVRPQSTEAWLGVAEASRQLGQFALTADALGRISDDDPRALKSLALRGDLLLSELRQPTAAIETWRRMLRTAPAADLPHKRLVYLYAMTLQRTRLKDEIRLAIELECDQPEMYVYLMLLPSLQFSDGLIKCADWLKGEPDNRELRIALAVHAARTAPSETHTLFETRGVMPGDRSLIRKCHEDYPDHPEVLAVLIDQAIYDDDVDTVEKLLHEASPEADEDSRFWRYRGWAALRHRSPQQAIEMCLKGLDVHPLDWRVRHILADAERVIGAGEASQKNSEIAARGKVLERSLLEMTNTSAADDKKLRELGRFAHDCSDELVAEALERRLGPLSATTWPQWQRPLP